MSQSKTSLLKWPSNWLFPEDKYSSIIWELLKRQQFAKFILDLGTELHLPNRCINTAVVYMHRFLMVHQPTRYYLIRVCQASLFLACKNEEVACPVGDVYKCTVELLKIQNVKSTEEFYKNEILDHEDILLSTLGFNCTIRHPYEIIDQAIKRIASQSPSLTQRASDELKKTSYYLARESLFLTPFCVKHAVDLISCFCIQLAIEIKIINGVNKNWVQMVNKSITAKQIQAVIHEFYVIYNKCQDKYKKNSVDEDEDQLRSTLCDKASNYIYSLRRSYVSSNINSEIGFLPSSLSNTEKQESSIDLNLSATSRPLLPIQCSMIQLEKQMLKCRALIKPVDHDNSQNKSDIDSKSVQTNASTGNKRRCDSPDNRNEAHKRSKE